MISIAMTSYNHAQYITDALKSVVAQAYWDWELIIVDDCSTDSSLRVIKDFIKSSGIQKKAKVFNHTNNVGYGSTLREAILMSSGELVLTLDSDDVLANNNVLSICVGIHEKHPEVSMTYSNYKVAYEDLKLKSVVETRQIEKNESYLKKGGAFAKGCKPGDELRVSLKISHLKVFKRKCYDMTEGIDPKLRKTVDKDLVFKLEEVGKLFHIDQFLMIYRKHVNSLAAQFGRSTPEDKRKIELARQSIYNNAIERRKQNKNGLRIFVDGSRRSAVSRMFPYWEKAGHRIVDSSKSADVQLSVVRIYSKTGLPTLLRIDGIYYDKAENFLIRNIPISESHIQADAVIYQSELSKLMCEKFLGERTTSVFKVIHNGVCEANWKRPARLPSKEVNIFSCAKWRRIKRLPELIKIFQMFLQKCPNAKLHIIGPMAKGAEEIPSPNVFYYGELNFEQIKELYRKADIHIHLCKKDSCPSNVPESIAAGVPVITTNLCGGAAEMCLLVSGCVVIREGNQSLSPDYIYQESYNAMTTYTMAKVIEAMSGVVKKGMRVELPNELSVEHVAQEYLSILKEIYASS